MQELGHLWRASPEFCVLHYKSSTLGQFVTFSLEEMSMIYTPNLKELSGCSVKILSVHLKLALLCLLPFPATLRHRTFLQLVLFCFQHLVQSWKGSRMPQRLGCPVGHRLLSKLQKIYVAGLLRARAGGFAKALFVEWAAQDWLHTCLWNRLYTEWCRKSFL